jgi:hypothetical protein
MTSTSWPRGRWPTLAIGAAIVLLGLAPRAWRLTGPGLTSDEAFSWRLTRYPGADMLRRASQDVHPPLYYLVLDRWLDLFGDGPSALRGLSVVAGLLTIALAFALVDEAARLDGRRCRTGAVLAALLVAIHATQVVQSRNARMYALGTALAAGGAWLLLRAQRAIGGRWAWWAAWGLAAAAAVATHYYLAFTAAAQAAWAAARRERPRRTREVALGALVAVAAFAPWAPALWRQARQVRAEYWIPPITTTVLVEGAARWALGIPAGGASLLVAIAVAASLLAAARAGRAGRFFAMQAAAPWVLGLVVSLMAGRPIVLERYMLFAQVFLLCAWAVAVARLEPRPLRIAGAAGLVILLGAGLVSTVRDFPAEPPAMANAARFLKRQVGPDDLVVVESPRALNKLRYYARQVDGERLDIRAALPERVPLSPHVSHVVSLADSDAVAVDGVFASAAATVWRGRESTAPPDPGPEGWTITYARIFEGGEATRFALVRYQRVPVP